MLRRSLTKRSYLAVNAKKLSVKRSAKKKLTVNLTKMSVKKRTKKKKSVRLAKILVPTTVKTVRILIPINPIMSVRVFTVFLRKIVNKIRKTKL